MPRHVFGGCFSILSAGEPRYKSQSKALHSKSRRSSTVILKSCAGPKSLCSCCRKPCSPRKNCDTYKSQNNVFGGDRAPTAWRGWPLRPGLPARVSSSSFVLRQENTNPLSPAHSHPPSLCHRNTQRQSQAPRWGLICRCKLFLKQLVDLKKLNIFFLRKSQCLRNKPELGEEVGSRALTWT